MNKDLFKKIINIFEMDSPDIKYDAIYIYNDGPGNIRALTISFGITEYGNLKHLIQLYIQKGGKYSETFSSYVNKIGKTSLVNDKNFKTLLQKSSREEQLMRDCQDEIYDQMYWNPALNWFNNNGFKEELSMGVIFDSFVHSGGILSFLRNRFKESVPSGGGNEKTWIENYLKVRKDWLANNSRRILRNTTYRCEFFLGEIKKDNWNLNCPLVPHDYKLC